MRICKTFKITSLLLVFVLCFVTMTTSVFAAKETVEKTKSFWSTELLLKELNSIPEIVHERYPDIAEVIDIAKEYCEENKNYEEVVKYVKGLEKYKIIAKKYGEKGVTLKSDEKMNKVKKMMETDEWKVQEKRINDLAKEYYNFYKLNGYYPEIESQINSTGIELQSAVTLTQGVAVMGELGYVMTEAELALRCAQVGTAALLDGPLPVGDIIALVGCAAILSYYIWTHLNANLTAVSNTINTYFSYSASQSAIQAVLSSANYHNSSSTYFYVHLNFNPGGGITFPYGAPISYNIAVATMLARSDNENVFSAYSNNAYAVANAACSLGSSPISHSAHTSNNMYNNLPHYHSTVLFIKQPGHSFYMY